MMTSWKQAACTGDSAANVTFVTTVEMLHAVVAVTMREAFPLSPPVQVPFALMSCSMKPGVTPGGGVGGAVLNRLLFWGVTSHVWPNTVYSARCVRAGE